MFRIAACLTVLLAAGALAAEPANGIYAWETQGPGPRIKRSDGGGGEVVLGAKVTAAFGQVAMQSVANDNSRFVVELKNAGPIAAGAEGSRYAVVVDGVCILTWSQSDLHADRTIDVNATVYGVEAARKMAAGLKVEPVKRKDPGHRVAVRWSPEKASYAPGEAVTLKMELRNAGTTTFAFMVGGQQRGPRDNQYRFIAQRGGGSGKGVPDTGDPNHHGGIGYLRTLKPGETFTASIPLGKWFNFTDPDTYRITGTFELELHEPSEGLIGRTIWQDLAVGECMVLVAK